MNELDRKIEDAEIEGWELKDRQGDRRAVMIDRKTGSLMAHLIIALLTVWWTFGLGNLVYLAYKYFFDVDKRVVSVSDGGNSDDD